MYSASPQATPAAAPSLERAEKSRGRSSFSAVCVERTALLCAPAVGGTFFDSHCSGSERQLLLVGLYVRTESSERQRTNNRMTSKPEVIVVQSRHLGRCHRRWRTADRQSVERCSRWPPNLAVTDPIDSLECIGTNRSFQFRTCLLAIRNKGLTKTIPRQELARNTVHFLVRYWSRQESTGG
jgi:hypothetical protein